MALLSLSPAFVQSVKDTLRVDAFVNVLSGLGGRKDKTTAAYAAPVRLLSTTELDWLFTGSDLAGRIVQQPVDDALRMGIYTGVPDLDKKIARWDLLTKIAEAWTWGRLYGQGAIFLGMNDRLGLPEDPLDWTRIREGDLEFLMVLEGPEISVASRIEDRRSTAYGDPRTYRLTTADGEMVGEEIHSSRMILFGGARTTSRVRARNMGRDLSVLQRPIEVLRDVDQSWRSTMLLLQDMSQAVFKIKGLMQMIANGQKQIAMDRMELVDMARSVARAVVIDADGEAFEHVGAQNVAAIDPLLVRTFTRLAAAADMPVTVLMGMSPAGLNATGDSDIRGYYARIKSQQTHVTPQVLKLIRLLAKVEGLPAPDEIKWPSLWDMTETERADLDLKRAQAAQIRTTAGITSGDEERLLWVRGADPEDVIDLTPAADPAAEAMTDIVPEPGSMWIDTEDGHRLEVTSVAGGNVYFLDLDSERPDRQWRFRLSSFLERARPAPPAPALPEPPTAPETAPGGA